MTDLDDAVRMGKIFHRLREPIFRSALRALRLPKGSRGLDAGCGVGLQTQLLAETVGPTGHVTGLDLSPELLISARNLAEQAGLEDRITFREGDVRNLPFDDDSLDWAWSMDLVGYAPLEPLPLVKELAREVKPGGRVAILAWSSETLLPGYPRLEARLDATAGGIAPFVHGKAPSAHFLRALGWFRAAGLEVCKAHTFSSDAHAPLAEDLRSALLALFEMRWPSAKSELSGDDWAAYRRTCQPESPSFVLDHPDYYAFFTYSMFQGTVAH